MPRASDFTLTIGYGSKLHYQRSTLSPTHPTTSTTETAQKEAPANLCCACHFSPRRLFFFLKLAHSLSPALSPSLVSCPLFPNAPHVSKEFRVTRTDNGTRWELQGTNTQRATSAIFFSFFSPSGLQSDKPAKKGSQRFCREIHGQGYYPAFVRKCLCGAARTSTRTERSRVTRPLLGRLRALPQIKSKSFSGKCPK